MSVKPSILYIANAKIPSRTANSIHVMKMCEAFSLHGYKVTLLVTDIPQLLWMQKPVILLDHLTKRYNYSYHMAPYCFRLSDFNVLYRAIGAAGPAIELRRELIDFFQCGNDSAQYEIFLKKQLERLFSNR